MIDVAQAIRHVPHFDRFVSVSELHALVEGLDSQQGFVVSKAGESAAGMPIHHVQFGSGSTRALIVGGPHSMEPISSLSVYTLLTLLQRKLPALLQADVEWHIVPCIDPDGAVLNEDWTQKPLTLSSFIKGYYVAPRPQQVDFSFPIKHGRIDFDSPCPEAAVLQTIIDLVQPDFFFSLHNFGSVGGAWFSLSRDIGERHHQNIYRLLEDNNIPLRTKPPSRMPSLPQYAPGMIGIPTMRGHYDGLIENNVEFSDEYLKGMAGASSLEYVLEKRPETLTFVAELPPFRYPDAVSNEPTELPLRKLKIEEWAKRKYVATTILDHWDDVSADLNQSSPFYHKMLVELVDVRDKLVEGVSEWYEDPLRHILTSQDDRGVATRADRVFVLTRTISFLGSAHSFLRLLKESEPTAAVRAATDSLTTIFDEEIHRLERELDLTDTSACDYDGLARAQLGSGLLALNSILET